MRETIMVYRDGNQMCALLGENLQTGVCGFGETIGDALRDLAVVLDREGWTSAAPQKEKE